MCPEADRDEVSIMNDKENAIRYMAGYVLYKLKKKRHAVDIWPHTERSRLHH